MNNEDELKQSLTKLRKAGYSRTELKEIVDDVCNENRRNREAT